MNKIIKILFLTLPIILLSLLFMYVAKAEVVQNKHCSIYHGVHYTEQSIGISKLIL